MAFKICLKANTMLILTVISAVMGVTMDLLFCQLHLSTYTILLISLPGDIVIRMLNMLILPLIVASMITEIANMDSKSSGKIGLFTMSYYMSTTVIAIFIGFSWVFCGRMRTITNVNGDCMTAAILQQFFHRDDSNGSAHENRPLPQDEGEMEEVLSLV